MKACSSTAIWQLEAKPARQLLPVWRGLRGDDLAWRGTVEWRALQLPSDIHVQKGNRYTDTRIRHSEPQTRSTQNKKTKRLSEEPCCVDDTNTLSHHLRYLYWGWELNTNQMSGGSGTQNTCIYSLVTLWDLYDPALWPVLESKRKDTFLNYLSPTSPKCNRYWSTAV